MVRVRFIQYFILVRIYRLFKLDPRIVSNKFLFLLLFDELGDILGEFKHLDSVWVIQSLLISEWIGLVTQLARSVYAIWK